MHLRHPISIAPMMDRSDRHYRGFMRLITRRALIYTEMITTGAILNGDRDYLLGFDAAEHPVALQLGGDDPRALAECAKMAEDRGYDEVNLNVGCPSSRVQAGCFGVSLMGRPQVVADAVAAMRAAVAIPVTVKHRIGFDDIDSYEHMLAFVDTVAAAGCTRFTVHARKAWLKGLSPKENRNVPPLRYADVHRLKRERPGLVVEINGGITTLDQMAAQLDAVDAVMVGRAAYDNPFLFAGVDERFYGEAPSSQTRFELAEAMIPYLERHGPEAGKLSRITRHMLNLFCGQPGAKAWKRALSAGHYGPKQGAELIGSGIRSVAAIQDRQRRESPPEAGRRQTASREPGGSPA